MSSQNIPLKARTDSPDPAEFWPQGLFAFELRAGDTQLGPRAAAIFSKRYAPTLGIERLRCKARIGRDFFRSKDAAGGQTSNTIAHFALDFERLGVKRNVVGLAPRTDSAPTSGAGCGGVWSGLALS